MDLKNAKLGDRFKVFLNDEKCIIDLPSKETLSATVIAVCKPNQDMRATLLGWRKNETRPSDAISRCNGTLSTSYNYIHDQKLFVFGLAVQSDLLVASQIMNECDGLSCRKCFDFYKFAVSNQEDGTLLCWSCRNTW